MINTAKFIIGWKITKRISTTPTLDRSRQHCKILQSALDGLVKGPVFVRAVPFRSTKRLQLAQVGIEVFLTNFFGRRTVRWYPDVFEESDDVVSETFVIFVEIARPLNQGVGFLRRVFSVVQQLFYENVAVARYETMR